MKLIDLGTAKILDPTKKQSRTYTIIGTPHYMAPEILIGKGYNLLIDLWSIGICLYEFMCGKVPFGEEAEDPYEIYEEIFNTKLSYPAFCKDRKAKKFMDQLINKVPEVRLGGSYAAIKGNAWFDDLDWDSLENYKLKPPFVPPENLVITQNQINSLIDKSIQITDKIAVFKKKLFIFQQADQKKQGTTKEMISKVKNWDSMF